MSERTICPVCGNPALEEAAPDETPCSPLRCSAWKVVGKATPPHPVTGARTMLRVVEGESNPEGQ